MQTADIVFEGAEKKLEIILDAPVPGLRARHARSWPRVAEAAGAAVLSHMATDRVDAFLLSESSLFVWDNRILMMTCGRTTPAHALPAILDVVGLHRVGLVFYERKNLLFPEDQPLDFSVEVAGIERYFSGCRRRLGPAGQDHVHVFCAGPGLTVPGEDMTFQLFMHDLPEWSMDAFAQSPSHTRQRDAVMDAIATLLPRMRTDRHFFSPCGFSLNAIASADYFTIHVTPQPVGSYASVETNRRDLDYALVVNTLVGALQPGRFSLVVTAAADRAGVARGEHLAAMAMPYIPVRIEDQDFGCGYVKSLVTARSPDRNTPPAAEGRS